MSRALTAANVAAVTLFIGFSVARHAPLEIFPAAWRKMLIRWRKAHSQRASSNAAQDSASVVSLGRAHPYDTAAGEATFKAWPAFNGDTKLAHTAGITRRQRLEVRPPLDSLFAGTSLRCRLSYALAERRALDRKEFFETFEFMEQARVSLRCGRGCRTCVECAGGHGLLGILLAVLEPARFDRVLVTDRRRPASFGVILDAAAAVAGPAVRERVRFEEVDFAAALLPTGCAVVCVHGCNSLTDKVIARAVAAEAESLAVMPCCYAHSEASQLAPAALRKGVGVALAADVQRTYTLEAAGFAVSWRHIPSVITPMNRVLVARRRSGVGDSPLAAQSALHESAAVDVIPCIS